MFYYNKAADNDHSDIMQSDHNKDHTDMWNEEVAKIAREHKQNCLEAGVVVSCSWTSDDKLFEVRWDCGAKRVYSDAKKELENIHILDMGPAGMHMSVNNII